MSTLAKTFFKYVSLNILGMLGLSCYILADTFFVAQGAGADGLAALNIAIPVFSVMNGVGLMIGMGGATRFSISGSDRAFPEAVYLSVFFSVVFVWLSFFTYEISAFLGANEDTLENTAIYLRVLLMFSPMFLMNNCITCFVRNDKNPKLSMLAMLVGSFSNIVLDYVFIFPMGLGMFGAALATGIAPVVGLMISSVHFLRHKNTFGFTRVKPNVSGFVQTLSLGTSSFVTEVSSGIAIAIFNVIILSLAGNTGVAAYGVITNVALVVIAMFTGVAQGMQPIASKSFGMGEYKNSRDTLKLAVITAVSMSVIIYAVSFVFAGGIVDIFNSDNNAELYSMAVTGLRIYFISFIFAGVNIVCAMYFSAVGNPGCGFLISMLRGIIILVPCAVVMSVLWGINGVWLCVVATEAVVSAVSLVMYRKKHF